MIVYPIPYFLLFPVASITSFTILAADAIAVTTVTTFPAYSTVLSAPVFTFSILFPILFNFYYVKYLLISVKLTDVVII